jgi:hypothetical protein
MSLIAVVIPVAKESRIEVTPSNIFNNLERLNRKERFLQMLLLHTPFVTLTVSICYKIRIAKAQPSNTSEHEGIAVHLATLPL